MKATVRSAIIYTTMFCQRQQGLDKIQLQDFVVSLLNRVGWCYEQIFESLVLLNELTGDEELPHLINHF